LGEMCPHKKPKKGREYTFSSQTSIILKLAYLGQGSNDTKFGKVTQFDTRDAPNR